MIVAVYVCCGGNKFSEVRIFAEIKNLLQELDIEGRAEVHNWWNNGAKETLWLKDCHGRNSVAVYQDYAK